MKNQRIRFLSVDPGDMATQLHFAAIPDANPKELYDPNNVAEDLLRFIAVNHSDQVRFSASQWRDFL